MGDAASIEGAPKSRSANQRHRRRARFDPDRIYAGTDSGRVWFTANGGITADADGAITTEVHADAACSGTIEAKNGSVFHGATTLNAQWPRRLPRATQ